MDVFTKTMKRHGGDRNKSFPSFRKPQPGLFVPLFFGYFYYFYESDEFRFFCITCDAGACCANHMRFPSTVDHDWLFSDIRCHVQGKPITLIGWSPDQGTRPRLDESSIAASEPFQERDIEHCPESEP